MIILLHGPDTFRGRQKLKEIERVYQEKHKSGFSFEKLYAPDIDFNQIKNSLQSGSLFDNSKLVVLEDLMSNKELKKEIATWSGLKNIKRDKNTIFILFETVSVLRDKEYKKVITLADKKQEFKELSAQEAFKWFSFYFKKRGELSFEVIQDVVKLCKVESRQGGGVNMWQAYNELNKIHTYSYGKKITKDMFKVLSVGGGEAQIFMTIDAIFKGDSDKAFYGILRQWQFAEAPEYIFYMIERQLKIIAEVKEQKDNKVPVNLIAKKIGEHPFVVKKTLSMIDRFSWSKIKELYSRVESLDSKSKTGQLNPYLSCELLAVAIAS